MSSEEYRRGVVEGERHRRLVNRDWFRDTFHTGFTFLIPVMVSSFIMLMPPGAGGGILNRTALRARFLRFKARYAERLHDARRRIQDGGEKNPFAAYREARAAQMEKEATEVKPPSGNPFTDMMESMMPLKKRQFRVEVKGTQFSDVIGIPEAKEEVKQYVDFLKNPSKFTRLGARLPRGCILTGEPGTGKTLLAKAVAGEAGVPFFSASGADFIEVMAGSGPKRVRELFQEARECAPCIVFIDEIDAVGTRGGNKSGGGSGTSSEENRTINQLLAELDGLSTSDDAVVVMAATNLMDKIDKALLREGRFDRKISIEMPDLRARTDVFKHYLDKVITGDKDGALKIEPEKKSWPTAGEDKMSMADAAKAERDRNTDAAQPAMQPIAGVDNAKIAERLAQLTPGASPATCATIINEAALRSAINGSTHVTVPELNAAIDNVLIGRTHRNRMPEHAKRRTAIHECGHALVAWLTPQQNDVLKISVIPRGQALGYTKKAGQEFHEYQTNVTLFTDVMVLLGGRAAEDVLLDVPSIGATDDMQRATNLVMQKLMAFGMDRTRVGLLSFHPEETQRGRSFVHFSENMQERAEGAAKQVVEEAYLRARDMIHKHLDKVEKMTKVLVEKDEVAKEEIEILWGPRPKGPTTAEWTKTMESIMQ